MDISNETIQLQPTANSQQPINVSDQLRKEIPNILECWEKWVRQEVEAARNLHPTDLKNSIPKVLENLAQALEFQGKNVRLEIKVAREHGKERSAFPQYTLEQIISEYRLLRRAIFSVIGKNVSDQERDTIIDAIEIGISEAASEFATQQYKLRERFISTLAHDLRSPLTSVKMRAELILQGTKKDELANGMAACIIDTIDRTDGIIKDLLDSNLLQMGQKLPLDIQSCDLITLVNSTLEEVASVHGDRFLIEADSAIKGYWDPSILQRVIGNLLTNAIKYGDKELPVKIKITQSETQVQIAVHNDGNPIAVEEQKSIFDNFFRAASAKSGQKEGWGIGLFLVKGAVAAHGGTVQVQSHEKVGTTFTIILPKDCRSHQQSEAA